MEFEVKQILGLSLNSKNSVCAIKCNDQNNDRFGASHLTYVACAGAGAVSASLLPQSTPAQQQRFYYQPPKSQQYSNATPSSPNVSPDSSTNGRSTSRMTRINKSICVDATSKTNQVVTGEDGGYMSRLLLYDLRTGHCLDFVTDVHQFGVHIVRFSPSGRLIASIGTPQDGYIYIWDTSQSKLTQLHCNKCISEIRDLIWINDTQLLTLGVRHLKLWNLDSQSFNGRNMVLGPLLEQTFECAQPMHLNGDLGILVGTNKGSVYRMPGGKIVLSNLQKPITAIAIAENQILNVSTQTSIYQYSMEMLLSSNLEDVKPLKEFEYGARALYSLGEETFYLTVHRKEANTIQRLTDVPSDVKTNILDKLSSFTGQKGIMFSASDSSSSILSWTGDAKNVLRWPSEVIQVPLNDITTAYEVKRGDSDYELIAGSLSGDIYLKNKCYSAHNGPVTDSHIYGNYAVSSGRDRCVQFWVRSYNGIWHLKQTLLFTSPVLKARLCCNESGYMAMLCCCVNKTVYIYSNTSDINVDDDKIPAFSVSPRSVLVKGMPFDMCSYQGLSVLSTNDKMVYVIDAWSEEKIRWSWRAHDPNMDLVNLTHIQVVNIKNQELLLGSSSNKAVILYDLINGDLITCQWGYGEALSGIAWTGSQLIAASDNIYISNLNSPAVIFPATATCSNSTVNSTAAHSSVESSIHLGSSSTVGTNSLPKLHLPNQDSTHFTTASPERKIFANTKSPTLRSRSISPVRTSPQSSISRSASPPPRMVKPASPLRERGRPTLTSNHGTVTAGVGISNQKPNLSYSLPKSSIPNTNHTAAKLIDVLREFVGSNERCVYNEELNDLLIAALNKQDGLSLVKYFGDRLCGIVEKQLDIHKS